MTRPAVSLLLFLLLASTFLEAVPVVHAVSPSLDCGGVSCVAVAGVTANNKQVILTGSLSTTASSTLVVVIVTSSSSGDSYLTPTVASVSMNSLCTTTGISPKIAVYYLPETSPLSSATVSENIHGTASGTPGAIVAFAISNYDTTTPFDPSATCTLNSGTGTTPSASISGLSNGNDFVFAGVGTDTDSPLAAAPATDIANTGNQVTTFAGDAGYVLGNGGGAYTISFSTPSSASWVAAIVAVNSSSPSAVPLFPSGVTPLLFAIPVTYWLFGKRTLDRKDRGGQA
jgi:hypothetical protein